MLPGFREIKFPASKGWNADIFILRPTPIKGDYWGTLVALKGTEWERQIPVLGGDLLTNALHGYTMPLMRVLGTPPRALALRMSAHACKMMAGKQCIGATDQCRPSGKGLPDCYAAPLDDLDAQKAASVVALAWGKGYHVVVFTEEGEFTL